LLCGKCSGVLEKKNKKKTDESFQYIKEKIVLPADVLKKSRLFLFYPLLFESIFHERIEKHLILCYPSNLVVAAGGMIENVVHFLLA